MEDQIYFYLQLAIIGAIFLLLSDTLDRWLGAFTKYVRLYLLKKRLVAWYSSAHRRAQDNEAQVDVTTHYPRSPHV